MLCNKNNEGFCSGKYDRGLFFFSFSFFLRGEGGRRGDNGIIACPQKGTKLLLSSPENQCTIASSISHCVDRLYILKSEFELAT